MTLLLRDEPASTGQQERELLLRMARRDPVAWKEFLDVYGDLLYTQVYRVSRQCNAWISQEEIQDIVQDLFRSLMEDDGRRLLTFEGRNGCSLGGWLRTVATRQVFDALRRRKPSESVDEMGEEVLHRCQGTSSLSDSLSPRDMADAEERMEKLQSALTKFSDRERLVFDLYFCDGYSDSEIAQILNMTQNNVDQYLFQIRGKLKKLLPEHFSS